MKNVFIVICFIISLGGNAQTRTLTADELLMIVKTHHPVARQAALQTSIAKADVLTARGGFDPLFQSNNSKKELEGSLYYDHAQHEIKIPSWYGVDVYAGLESVQGDKASPVETKGRSSYVGVSVPLLRNVITDSRRAALKQAKIFHEMSFAEQKETLNNLVLDAMKAYWNWWEQYAAWRVFNNAMENAQKRIGLVKTAFRHGERPAIDTLEAVSQLQAVILRKNEIEMQLNNARLQLSLFLWVDGTMPYEPGEDLVPDTKIPAIPEQLHSVDHMVNASKNHPQLQVYRLKLDALHVDRRLKMQSLLPAVTVKYNQLTRSYDLGKAITNNWFNNNYRYGIQVAMPLRLSEARGQYQKAKLKIEQTKLDQSLKRLQIENKVRQYYNEWKQLQQQVGIQKETVVMLQQLQRGEEQRFLNGESSLFLINSREAKTLEAQQKLIETQGKLQKAINQAIWASGQLIE